MGRPHVRRRAARRHQGCRTPFHRHAQRHQRAGRLRGHRLERAGDGAARAHRPVGRREHRRVRHRRGLPGLDRRAHRRLQAQPGPQLLRRSGHHGARRARRRRGARGDGERRPPGPHPEHGAAVPGAGHLDRAVARRHRSGRRVVRGCAAGAVREGRQGRPRVAGRRRRRVARGRRRRPRRRVRAHRGAGASEEAAGEAGLRGQRRGHRPARADPQEQGARLAAAPRRDRRSRRRADRP